MKFHEYDDTYSITKRCMKILRLSADEPLTTKTVYKAAVDSAEDRLEHLSLYSEAHWWESSRPYYNVFPSMLDSLSKLNIDKLPFSVFHPQRERFLAIQFPVDYETFGIAAILVGFHEWPIGCSVSVRLQHTNVDTLHGVNTPDTTDLVFNCTSEYSESPVGNAELKGQWNSAADWARKIVYSVLLMEHDPDFFEPHVLTADQTKFDNAKSEEHRQALINKAVKKRGRRGYVIGRQMETIPHFRRPHPALRWTGKGGKIPKVVMVKGSIVHRSKLTQVPTGRYGSEEVVS